MAVFNLKSTIITNRDAVPKVLTDSYVSGGPLHAGEGYVQTGSAADSVASTYKLLQVPSNCRIADLKLSNGAGGGSAAVNIGVYYPSFIPVGASGLTAALAGTVISAAYFASAQSVVSAANNVDVLNQSGSNTIPNQELPLWQALGLSADPGIFLDIVVSVSTVLAAQIYIGLKVIYAE